MHLPLPGVVFMLLFTGTAEFEIPQPVLTNLVQPNRCTGNLTELVEFCQRRSPEPDLPRRRQGGGTR
jgi:hypothetical protein